MSEREAINEFQNERDISWLANSSVNKLEAVRQQFLFYGIEVANKARMNFVNVAIPDSKTYKVA